MIIAQLHRIPEYGKRPESRDHPKEAISRGKRCAREAKGDSRRGVRMVPYGIIFEVWVHFCVPNHVDYTCIGVT